MIVDVGEERFEGGCGECGLRNQIMGELVGAKRTKRRKRQQTDRNRWDKMGHGLRGLERNGG